jgi:hypothetical protein
MLRDLLGWLAGSVYWSVGYKRARMAHADALDVRLWAD